MVDRSCSVSVGFSSLEPVEICCDAGGRSSKLIDGRRGACSLFGGGAVPDTASTSSWLACGREPRSSCDCSGVGKAFGAAFPNEDLVALREDVFLAAVVFVEVGAGLVHFVVFVIGDGGVEARGTWVVFSMVILRVLGMLLKWMLS